MVPASSLPSPGSLGGGACPSAAAPVVAELPQLELGPVLTAALMAVALPDAPVESPELAAGVLALPAFAFLSEDNSLALPAFASHPALPAFALRSESENPLVLPALQSENLLAGPGNYWLWHGRHLL